jgi:hypothetical protein
VPHPSGISGAVVSSPFRGLLPYEESGAPMFFGRRLECEALFQQVVADGARVTALTGTAGVGKTSLLRAGLTPMLAKHGIQTLYLSAYEGLEQEIWQAASRTSAEPPTSGESPVDYLVRVSRAARAGTVLVLDHLEDLFGEGGGPRLIGPLGNLLARGPAAARAGVRGLLSIDPRSFNPVSFKKNTLATTP